MGRYTGKFRTNADVGVLPLPNGQVRPLEQILGRTVGLYMKRAVQPCRHPGSPAALGQRQQICPTTTGPETTSTLQTAIPGVAWVQLQQTSLYIRFSEGFREELGRILFKYLHLKRSERGKAWSHFTDRPQDRAMFFCLSRGEISREKSVERNQ